MRLWAPINQLEGDLARFRIDFERFFNGALPTPPEALRQRIRRRLAELRGDSRLEVAGRFRLGSLEARFNALNELYNRRLRENEAARRQNADGARPATRERPEVMVDESTSLDLVARLFEPLYGAASERKLGAFHRYLLAEAETIRGRTGCARVAFRVEYDGRRHLLRARPLHEP